MSAAISQTAAEQVSQPRAKESLRVVLFSGGSGTRSLTEYLLRHPQVDLTVLVNCYDDGHSTGRLRRFIPGMLGPSDIRKNISRMMPQTDRCHRALAALSDFRLEKKAPFDASMRLVRAFADLRLDRLPDAARTHAEALSVAQARVLARYCSSFAEFQDHEASRGRFFDFDDCAIGNIIFGGCFLSNGRSFNRTVAALSADYEIRGTLLNITRGENLFLVAIDESGSVFRTEADIVSRGGDTRIRTVALVPEGFFYSRLEPEGLLSDDAAAAEITAASVLPALNPDADLSLRAADVIIYGPGTQHSSLLPSYLTRGTAQAIAANRSADKVFIANIRRDHDIPHDSVNDLADKLLGALRNGSSDPVEWDDAVTHFFVQDVASKREPGYVPFDRSRFPYNPKTLRVYDWESHSGGHDGGILFEELRRIVQSRIEISLEPLQHMVSIVVPALNEEKTIEQVLGELVQLDLSSLGISKEILVADGGSTDRTADLARQVRGVKVLSPAVRIGRGEALRRGLEQARGDLILFYPSDNEYRVSDIPALLTQLTTGKMEAVFGTRNVLLADLKGRLDAVYSGHKGLSIVSRYGGILISVLTLILYNRYVSDTLTSVKAFDARVLRDLRLRSKGVDLDMEIVAKLSRRRKFILEIPVSFVPRGVEQGKKIRMRDGFAAVLALFRFRLGKTARPE